MKNEIISRHTNTCFKVRKLRIKCLDCFGQIKTFTVDEKGVQNSPSFDSAYTLFRWANEPHNRIFHAELLETNKFLNPNR